MGRKREQAVKPICCVCAEEIEPGEKVIWPEHDNTVVHDPQCTFFMPHRVLSPEAAAAFRKALTALGAQQYQVREGGWPPPIQVV